MVLPCWSWLSSRGERRFHRPLLCYHGDDCYEEKRQAPHLGVWRIVGAGPGLAWSVASALPLAQRAWLLEQVPRQLPADSRASLFSKEAASVPRPGAFRLENETERLIFQQCCKTLDL